MSRELHVHLLPDLIEPTVLHGGIAVVIDILRASTTIVHALASGCRAVVPCLTVEEAIERAAVWPSSEVVLGGERGGQLIPGFDRDNSPLNYSSSAVSGRTVVFTTTNGTRALLKCGVADQVWIGAFANISTIIQSTLSSSKPVHLVCAGTEGQVTSEDCLFASAVIAEMLDDSDTGFCLNDSAVLVRDHYRAHAAPDARFTDALRESRGGQNLIELGCDADIECCAQWNYCDILPEFDHGSHEIRAVPVT